MQPSAWIWANVLCVALGCQGIVACGAPPAGPPPVLRDAPGPHELVVEGVQVERWVEGRLRLSARADRAALDRRGGTVRGRQVTLVARDPDGLELGHVSGRELVADLAGARVELTGDVVLEDRTGRTITATSAVYTSADQRVRAPGRVRMEGANFWAEGRALTADLEAGTVDVGGPLTSQVRPR